MAKRDVILRFAQAEHEYLEMTKLLNDLQTDLAAGTIDVAYYEEHAPLIETEITNVKTKYFFWGEVIYELNRPNRRSKKLNTTEQTWYNELRTVTKECLKDESKDALATFLSPVFLSALTRYPSSSTSRI